MVWYGLVWFGMVWFGFVGSLVWEGGVMTGMDDEISIMDDWHG